MVSGPSPDAKEAVELDPWSKTATISILSVAIIPLDLVKKNFQQGLIILTYLADHRV
jgi:hypothetical protein